MTTFRRKLAYLLIGMGLERLGRKLYRSSLV